MFKKSFYNIEIPREDNSLLLFNCFSGALVVLNENFQKLLSNIESYQEVDAEIIELIKKGFVVHENLDECNKLTLAHNIQKYTTKSLDLVIAVTLLCNMDCPYCFENKKNITITKEIEDNLISFIDKNTPNEGSLNISWFGGEPLLQKDLIYRLSKKIKLLCKNKNINYKSNIVTNGVLLDYETAKYLKNECEVGFSQITIDGLKETHDKRRCLKNGQSSFDIIINNIEKIQEFFNVQIRINIDKDNIEESIELIKFFKQRHWNKNIQYYFAPVWC